MEEEEKQDYTTADVILMKEVYQQATVVEVHTVVKVHTE